MTVAESAPRAATEVSRTITQLKEKRDFLSLNRAFTLEIARGLMAIATLSQKFGRFTEPPPVAASASRWCAGDKSRWPARLRRPLARVGRPETGDGSPYAGPAPSRRGHSQPPTA